MAVTQGAGCWENGGGGGGRRGKEIKERSALLAQKGSTEP